MINQETEFNGAQPAAENQETISPEINNNQLMTCQKELTDLQNRYNRLAADFENFKKRLEKDQAAAQFAMQRSVLLPLLEIVDNFDRALQQSVTHESVQAYVTGFSLIRKELQKFLEKFGVKEITHNESFNPELHEAVMSSSVADKASGSIIAVLQKGYTLHNDVLRPAKVSIAE